MRVVTILVVTILVLNPEFFLLGLFIDGVGLEILFMLFGIQIFVLTKNYYIAAKMFLVTPIKESCIKLKSGTKFVFTTTIEPIDMIALVLSGLIGLVANRV